MVTRIYLPPDPSFLSMSDHCLRSIDYVNVIVADNILICSIWIWMWPSQWTLARVVKDGLEPIVSADSR